MTESILICQAILQRQLHPGRQLSFCREPSRVLRANVDKILTEESNLWNKARNSSACVGNKQVQLQQGPAPQSQCFQYFTKCSVYLCCSVETAKKPHKHRCTRCYYFHFCSDACKDYADTFGLHDCDFTQPLHHDGILTLSSSCS
jgi:hypothetical protein